MSARLLVAAYRCSLPVADAYAQPITAAALAWELTVLGAQQPLAAPAL
jgi:hypothetical protein